MEYERTGPRHLGHLGHWLGGITKRKQQAIHISQQQDATQSPYFLFPSVFSIFQYSSCQGQGCIKGLCAGSVTAMWHLCVESWLLCTPSLPLLAGEREARVPSSRQPSFLLPQDTLGRYVSKSSPRVWEKAGHWALPTHLCPGAVAELAA